MKILLLLSVMVLTAGCVPQTKTEILSVKVEADKEVTLRVEVADNEVARARGLMGRAFLAEDSGMLFILDHEEPTAFWMKNTLIPLDMIFIAKSGKIESIYPMAEPKSLKIVKSKGPVVAGLEIRGGMADKLGLKPGQKVSSPSLPKPLVKP